MLGATGDETKGIHKCALCTADPDVSVFFIFSMPPFKTSYYCKKWVSQELNKFCLQFIVVPEYGPLPLK